MISGWLEVEAKSMSTSYVKFHVYIFGCCPDAFYHRKDLESQSGMRIYTTPFPFSRSNTSGTLACFSPSISTSISSKVFPLGSTQKNQTCSNVHGWSKHDSTIEGRRHQPCHSSPTSGLKQVSVFAGQRSLFGTYLVASHWCR